MDKELDDLLDSALEDFDKKLTTKDATETSRAGPASVTIERTNLYVDDVDDEDRPTLSAAARTVLNTSSLASPPKSGTTASNDMKLFEEIFSDEKSKENMKQFKEAFDMFQGSNDEANLLQNFQKVMSELVNEDVDLGNDDEDFENVDDFNFFKKLVKEQIDQTETAAASTDAESKEKQSPLKKVLDDMNKNSEKVLKNTGTFPFGSDFLSSLTGMMGEEGLGASVAGDEDSATALMMQPILSMLFSKDILYPSLKLMLENYDKYIEEKRAKMTEAELGKCYEQKDCIQKMCQVYDESKETDTREAKAEQLKKILDLLEKCGMPPSELVPEVNPFENIGEQLKGCPIS